MTGKWFQDTLLHLRPRSWPIVFAHYSAGTLCAFAIHRAPLNISNIMQAVLGGVLWTVGLNGGTLALNSAFDKDTGDIGYLDNPPPVPRGLALTGFLLMAAALVLAWCLLPVTYTTSIGVSVLLSIVYSVPPFRWKAVAGADLLINMIGYGALTFFAGAAALDLASNRSLVLLAISFGFLFAAFYPMTQIYQIESDAAAGDRTLAVRLGTRVSLIFAAACLLIVAALQIAASLPFAPRLEHGMGIRLALVVLPNLAWLAFTIDWLRRWKAYPSQKGMYRALQLWALSDIVLVVAFFC